MFNNGVSMRQRSLGRDIALVIVVKLLLLALLWNCFVRDARVAAGSEETAGRLIGHASPMERPTQPGESSAK